MAPGLEEPKYELVDIYKTRGEIKRVISLYQDILHTNPDNIEIAFELALAYQNNHRPGESAVLLKQTGEKSLSDRLVIRTLIKNYLEEKRYDEALVLLKGMMAGAPESEELYYISGIAHDGKGDKQLAITCFEKVGRESQFFLSSAVQIALIYEDTGNIDKAIEYLTQLLQEMPQQTEFYLYLGAFYEQKNLMEKAIESFSKGLEVNPEHIRLLFRLGVVYDKAGNKEASIEKMKAIIAIDPEHTNALNYLGYTYADLGINLDEAERLITSALKNKPDDGYITDSLGWVYYKKEMFEQAVHILEKAVTLVPDDPIILEHLGDAYLKLNQPEKALHFYKKSLSIKKEDRQELEKKIDALAPKGF